MRFLLSVQRIYHAIHEDELKKDCDLINKRFDLVKKGGGGGYYRPEPLL